MEYIEAIRRKVGTDQVLVPSNACIVVNPRGQVLLQMRSDIHVWGCPGGIMDIGETARESAARELLEETGLVAGSLDFFGIYSGPGYEATYPNGDRIVVVQIVFIANVGEQKPISDKESLELRYFAPDELPTPLNKHHHEFMAHYLEYIEGKREVPIIQ